jgi:hypothetical protein
MVRFERSRRCIWSPATVRALAGGVAVVLVSLGVASVPVPAGAAAGASCRSSVPHDVNGDGLAEVAVGESGNHHEAGAVHVFYGHRSGLVTKATGSARNDQYFTQATRGVPGSEEDDDRFGHAVTLGDFDDDGCADLAVGVPGEDIEEEGDEDGAITILYGSPSGITTTGAQKFDADTLGPGINYLANHLAVVDVDDDGIDDLAATALGGVVVLHGDANGLNQGVRPDVLTADSLDLPGSAGAISGGLSSGDFDGDGIGELAVGTSGTGRSGTVITVERGATGYLSSAPITLTSPGIPDSPEDFVAFGSVQAAGDVDDDGYDDLAVGLTDVYCDETPDDCDIVDADGAVVILPGSKGGLTSMGAEWWTQDSPGVVGGSNGDSWGFSLAMGHLDPGPTDDLVIGAPTDVSDGIRDAGSVTVLLGSPDGLTTAGVGGAIFHQGISGIAGRSERYDAFGSSLTTAYLQSSKQESVIVGSGESLAKAEFAGQICQLSIGSSGPRASGSRTLNAASKGVAGAPGEWDSFGNALG